MKISFLTFLLTVFCFPSWGSNVVNGQNVTTEASSTVNANDDLGRFARDKPVEINVLDNDFGLGGGVKSLLISKAPLHGTVRPTAKFTLVFTPSFNYLGDDEFEYTVCALDGACSTATVFVSVTEYDYQPVLVNDTIVYENDPKRGRKCDVLRNDINVWDAPLVVKIVTQLKNGAAVVNEDNTITPVFNGEFRGKDTLSYSVADREGDSDTAMVFFEVIDKIVVFDSNNPNAISPNGDGLNDVFIIPILADRKSLQIQVYSAWGQLVFEDPAYQNNWDGIANSGSLKGKLVPNGSYYYAITIDGETEKLKGFVFISK